MQNQEIVFSAAQYLIKLPFVHANQAMGMLYLQQTVFRIDRKLRESFPGVQIEFVVKGREAINRLLHVVEPNNYLGYLAYFAAIRSEMEYDEPNFPKAKEHSDKLINLWTGKITLYLGRKEHDVPILRALGYSLHLLQLQRPDSSHLLYELASRCFELALSYQPENVSTLLAYGETCMHVINDNYSMLRFYLVFD